MCELRMYLASYKWLQLQYVSGVPVAIIFIGNHSTKNISTCVDCKAYGATGCKKDHYLANNS